HRTASCRRFAVWYGLRKHPAVLVCKNRGDLRVKSILGAIVLGIVLLAPAAHAQSGPERGGHDLQIWTGGGHGLNGSTASTGLWNVDLRYGWILTDPIAPGPLRGRFEYAVDVVPVFCLTQKTGTACGFGLNPFALKWNFVEHH